MVQKLTESRFGISKLGIPISNQIEIRSFSKRPRTGARRDVTSATPVSGLKRDYRDGWGVRVRRPFGARGMSSVRYRTRLGDLKNKQSTERVSLHPHRPRLVVYHSTCPPLDVAVVIHLNNFPGPVDDDDGDGPPRCRDEFRNSILGGRQRLGVALGPGAAGAGGCAWPRWPAAGPLVVFAGWVSARVAARRSLRSRC